MSISKFAHGPVTETLGWMMGKLLKFPVQKLAKTDNNVEHRKQITGYFPKVHIILNAESLALAKIFLI